MALFRRYGILTVCLLASSVATAKEIKLFVHSTSGPFFVFSRLVASHLPKHLPGSTVHVQSLPGASGAVVLNYLSEKAPTDGSEIAIVNPPTILLQAVGSPSIRYDLRNMVWLGSASDGRKSPRLLVAHRDRKKMVAGSEAGVSNLRLIKRISNLEMTLVEGYAGINDTLLAFRRNELTVIHRSLEGLANDPDLLDRSKYDVVLQYGSGGVRHPNYPDVVTLAELALPGQSFLLDLLESYSAPYRAFVAPPSADPQAVAKLRLAFDALFQDPDFIHDAKRIGVQIDPLSWHESEGIIRHLIGLDEVALSALRQLN